MEISTRKIFEFDDFRLKYIIVRNQPNIIMYQLTVSRTVRRIQNNHIIVYYVI